jgi:hypothetical protein
MTEYKHVLDGSPCSTAALIARRGYPCSLARRRPMPRFAMTSCSVIFPDFWQRETHLDNRNRGFLTSPTPRRYIYLYLLNILLPSQRMTAWQTQD